MFFQIGHGPANLLIYSTVLFANTLTVFFCNVLYWVCKQVWGEIYGISGFNCVFTLYMYIVSYLPKLKILVIFSFYLKGSTFQFLFLRQHMYFLSIFMVSLADHTHSYTFINKLTSRS